MTATGEITELLEDAKLGKPEALPRLIPLVYQELRRMAGHFMRNQRPDHTLQATALVHEVYLRLTGKQAPAWSDQAHFFASAAQTMRSLLVDHSRARSRQKRGGGADHMMLDPSMATATPNPDDFLALDAALTRLAEIDPRAAQAVELRYFVGLSVEEVAEISGVSVKTIERDWRFASSWLRAELRTT
jgi:RNA polymerase sigma-70 factor, ECF subfamily